MHLVRHSLFYVSHKDRKEVASDLKLIYQAATLEQADQELANFAVKWQTTYPAVVRSWQNNWGKVIPMFTFVPEIRKAIYRGECDRIAEYDAAKGHQKPGTVPVG